MVCAVSLGTLGPRWWIDGIVRVGATPLVRMLRGASLHIGMQIYFVREGEHAEGMSLHCRGWPVCGPTYIVRRGVLRGA